MYTPQYNKQAQNRQAANRPGGQTHTAGFDDKRPEALLQQKQQETIRNSPQALQLKAIQQMANDAPMQFMFKRPTFSGPATKQKKFGAKEVQGDEYDMAHRLSYHDIAEIVSDGDPNEIQELIEAVTIPQRDFGQYKKGDLTYYKQVMLLKGNPVALVKALNNSPFNLRPGASSTNRSIGAGFDGNIDDSGYETEQSETLRPLARTLDPQDRTSSYLNDQDLGKWEKSSYKSLFK